MMGGLTLQTASFLVAAGILGVVLGWLFRGWLSALGVDQLTDEWQTKLNSVTRERDRSNAEIANLRTSIEAQKAVVLEHQLAAGKAHTELESMRAKSQMLSNDMSTLRAEREDYQNKISASQNELNSLRRKTEEHQEEFVKAGDLYKGELAKSFDKRKMLDSQIEDLKMEHQSLSDRLQASQSENESANEMLASAQSRLENLDVLQQRVVELEAENAELEQDSTRMTQEIETYQQDVAELVALKTQYSELEHCLESMQNVHTQYETDTEGDRDYAGRSEIPHIELDEAETHFATMETQQLEALKKAPEESGAQKSNGQTAPQEEADDLKEIVGVGKVFENTLHELGIFRFQQIAALNDSDIARVDSALKDFKGRMEQDDWVGQARELHYKKYGETHEH